MKHFFTLLSLLVTSLLMAQNFQGIAVYESRTSFKEITSSTDGKADPEMEKMFREQLAKAMEKRFFLKFDKTESIYEEEEKLAEPGGNNWMQASLSGTGGKQYKNLKTKMFLLESDMFGKEFLITDSLTKYDWKLENETKKIGNYTCYKATYTIKPVASPQSEKDKKGVSLFDGIALKDYVVTAWYTPEVPVGHGPGAYWGLPGLILEANDGNTTLLCSKLTLNPKEV